MARGNGGDKGSKIRAERALAEAEKGAEAQNGAGAADSKTEKRQKEDSNDGKPSKKLKQVANKAKQGYRVKPKELREKQISKKSLGVAPGVRDGTYGTNGFQGMESERESKEDLDEYVPEEGEKIGTNRNAHKEQSGNRQNSADNLSLVPYKTPEKVTHPRQDCSTIYT
jgi:hypothetical protein